MHGKFWLITEKLTSGGTQTLGQHYMIVWREDVIMTEDPGSETHIAPTKIQQCFYYNTCINFI